MRRKGVALLLALFILILVSLLVIAFLELTTTDLQIVSNHMARNQALYIADAGVEYAISQLIRNGKQDFSTLPIELPSGSGNTYSVTYSAASGTIRSMGRLASDKQITLEVKVSVIGSPPHYNVKIIYYREL